MHNHFDTIVIGGGQAGLAVGYQLRRRGVPFVIFDAQPRTGDVWRNRWDSLKLFTPARFNGLAGLPFPAAGGSFITKNQMADYLEAYARKFNLPIRGSTRVDRVARENDRFVVTANGETYTANNVVVAMADYQTPKTPTFATQLAPRITQLHSSAYCNPDQLQAGPVLVVGLGNSGAEIGKEVVRSHRTYVSGRSPGEVPFRMESLAGREIFSRLVIGVLFHHLLTLDTPLGRRAQPQRLSQATPLIRVRSKDLLSAGVELVPRTAGIAANGLPELEDGRMLDVANVIWCTGYRPGFEWIDVPLTLEHGRPQQRRGVVADQPGLYFVGLEFEYAMSSSMVQGVSRDAAHVARLISAAQRPSTISTIDRVSHSAAA